MTDEIETLIAIVCEANDDEHKRHSRAIAPVDDFRMGVVLQWAEALKLGSGLAAVAFLRFPTSGGSCGCRDWETLRIFAPIPSFG